MIRKTELIEVTTVSGDLNVDASFTSRLVNGKGVARYAEMAPFPPAPPRKQRFTSVSRRT